MSFKDDQGRRFPSRRKVLEFMIDDGNFGKEIIYYVRDGLLDEGWCYHQDLKLALPTQWTMHLLSMGLVCGKNCSRHRRAYVY